MRRFKSIGLWILTALLVFALVTWFTNMNSQDLPVYSDLVREIREGNVTELVITGNVAAVTFEGEERAIEIGIPNYNALRLDVGEELWAEMIGAEIIRVDTPIPRTAPWWVSLLPTLGLLVILVILWVTFQQSQGGGRGGPMSVGRSRAKLQSDTGKKKNFDDVAGADEEKEELKEMVDFLRSPGKFRELGARIPKGVLLVGPPGTGKTLLAKSVAGEAGVPFFTISGSEFVEMFVGVGASRVRDMFEQAKKSAPCIVFIDEIDAVGRHRGAGLGGGHDEREQTLNQLLVEMDGFGVNEGVIIIAATNRPDVLDPALLRPGRFDRQVVVDIPDVGGREAILKVHSRGKPLADDVDLAILAKTTVGFTGADLENLMNEGALLSARRNKKTIGMEELEESIIKVVAGPEKKTRVITEKERELTAYHEAGHAIVAKMLPTQDRVHQVSIVPRGRAGGYTLSLPKDDRYYMSKTEMTEEIIVLLGGRTAEKLVLDDISTGASNDIQRATKLAREMITKYGMSDKLGPINFNGGHEVFIGKDLTQSKAYSEHVAAEIDAEISKLINDCYARANDILTANMDKLNLVAQQLLEKEKLDAEEFEAIFA
ncbi:MAG: ATP-dependent zinc metalloprotease FtsH [Oscillospiraceae bacterium]|nr:ATP-dependent zinc metalloprotease FtsH [Oscillospiraceae bacterium]